LFGNLWSLWNFTIAPRAKHRGFNSSALASVWPDADKIV
jgi:hypothetical protein